MKKGLIGIQMSTIKQKIDELGAYGTLKACAELGYHCVEISQIPMTPENVGGMKKACDEFGIKVAAWHRLPGAYDAGNARGISDHGF